MRIISPQDRISNIGGVYHRIRSGVLVRDSALSDLRSVGMFYRLWIRKRLFRRHLYCRRLRCRCPLLVLGKEREVWGRGFRSRRRGGRRGRGGGGLIGGARGFSWGGGGEGRICELFGRRWREGRMLRIRAAEWGEEGRVWGGLRLVVKRMGW